MMRVRSRAVQPAGAEALGQRHQIVGAERGFELGQRAERQHQPCAARRRSRRRSRRDGLGMIARTSP